MTQETPLTTAVRVGSDKIVALQTQVDQLERENTRLHLHLIDERRKVVEARFLMWVFGVALIVVALVVVHLTPPSP